MAEYVEMLEIFFERTRVPAVEHYSPIDSYKYYEVFPYHDHSTLSLSGVLCSYAGFITVMYRHI